MKNVRYLFFVFSLMFSFLLTGCAGMSEGAAVGALAGVASGKTNVGRAAAFGALGGAAVCANGQCGGRQQQQAVAGGGNNVQYAQPQFANRPPQQTVQQQHPGCSHGARPYWISPTQPGCALPPQQPVYHSQGTYFYGGQQLRSPLVMGGGANGNPYPQVQQDWNCSVLGQCRR